MLICVKKIILILTVLYPFLSLVIPILTKSNVILRCIYYCIEVNIYSKLKKKKLKLKNKAFGGKRWH